MGITSQPEGIHAGEFINTVAMGSMSFEQGTLDAGTLVPGAVLGKVTIGGKLLQLNPSAVDGSQNAVGILVSAADASVNDQAVTYLAHWAEVNGALLTWPAGISGPQKTAAIAQLGALNIIVR